MKQYPDGRIGIETPEELQLMQNDLTGHYVLENDIDCTGITVAPIGSPWGSSGWFSGTFDGQQHKISNLAIQKNGYWGMFVRFRDGATIRNIVFENPIFPDSGADARAAVVCSTVESGTITIEQVGIRGMILHSPNVAQQAGLIALANNAGINLIVRDCYVQCDLVGTFQSGALIGNVSQANSSYSVSHCYGSGSVVSNQTAYHKLIGAMSASCQLDSVVSMITSAYSHGSVPDWFGLGYDPSVWIIGPDGLPCFLWELPAPEIINVTADPLVGEAPLTVLFAVDAVNADGILWAFGDGETGYGPEAEHAYQSAGLYIATVTVSNLGGVTVSDSVIIEVSEPTQPEPPAVVVKSPCFGWQGIFIKR